MAAQLDGTLVLAAVDQAGVPMLSWQQPGQPWHAFVRVAAPDNRYPDGFSVPADAALAMALQRDGSLVLAIVDRTGVPQISWQQPGQPWHSFERVAQRDPRYPDGFTVPPGADLSLAQRRDGTMILTVVDNDRMPYVSWRLDGGF